jgi:hypothetical protein
VKALFNDGETDHAKGTILTVQVANISINEVPCRGKVMGLMEHALVLVLRR